MTKQAEVITVELLDGTKVIVPDSLEQITPYVLREQGDWFEDEIKFLRRLVKPGDTVLDIGANYGVYALSLARKVGPSGQLWAFEPGSDTAQLLTASSALNGTSWLHVVQQAISDREGTGWLQTPGHSELNSLANAVDCGSCIGMGESVTVSTLDQCLERFNWTEVHLLKIDAEGEEERILKGGTRFFQEFSPLVMFEVKAGAELHLHLVERFAEIGYQCFRLIPGLDVLTPFSPEQGIDSYLLNLFAAKPDCTAALASSGWLVQQETGMAIAAADENYEQWLQALQHLPYARRLAPSWQSKEKNEEQLAIQHALAAWACAQDASVEITRRYAALIESHTVLQRECKLGCPAVRWGSLARVALAVGERTQAIHALNTMLTELQAGVELTFDEPFLCPDLAMEGVEPTGPMKAWLEAVGLVALEQAESFSGFYTGRTSHGRLEKVLSLGYEPETIERRITLIRQRFGAIRTTPEESTSVRDWFNFLGLKEPICCLDVGELDLGGEADPWVSWAQEGLAKVWGFEPLQIECDQLNKKVHHRENAIRYLPWALGDGLEHTLHITNAPMTSSLFPPARSTVDLFPLLGELMQVEQQVRVQTHRLDDIEEVAAADFLKLDVQGAELMILKNAQECLRSISVIQCEVEFIELYEGQPLMADIDAFLRSQGFCFLQFVTIMGRPFKQEEDRAYLRRETHQTLWADAIYVRDFRRLDNWRDRHLKAAAFILHEVYHAYNFTIFILKELDRRRGSYLQCYYQAALRLVKEYE